MYGALARSTKGTVLMKASGSAGQTCRLLCTHDESRDPTATEKIRQTLARNIFSTSFKGKSKAQNLNSREKGLSLPNSLAYASGNHPSFCKRDSSVHILPAPTTALTEICLADKGQVCISSCSAVTGKQCITLGLPSKRGWIKQRHHEQTLGLVLQLRSHVFKSTQKLTVKSE